MLTECPHSNYTSTHWHVRQRRKRPGHARLGYDTTSRLRCLLTMATLLNAAYPWSSSPPARARTRLTRACLADCPHCLTSPRLPGTNRVLLCLRCTIPPTIPPKLRCRPSATAVSNRRRSPTLVRLASISTLIIMSISPRQSIIGLGLAASHVTRPCQFVVCTLSDCDGYVTSLRYLALPAFGTPHTFTTPRLHHAVSY